MKRIASVCVLALGVAACGDGNPFTDTGGGTGGGTGANTINGTALNADLTANSVVFDDNGTADPSDDTLVINNLPFDNSDTTGGGYTNAGALPNGFQRFESPVLGTAGELRYFAVFRETNFARVTAVGTGDFVEAGFGGVFAERIGGGGVPAGRAASYTFTGDYAAVRIGTANGGTNDVQFVTGDAVLTADILDFDTNGAVGGFISNRELFASDGTALGPLNDFISLANADIDFDTATIDSSTASTQENGAALGTGNWQGIFAGPNGEEIAGIVVIEGSKTAAEPTDTVRETGTFIVVNGG